jgi:hypothetical protein
MAISLGGGGSASVINEKKEFNSAENLITLADGRVYLKGGVTETNVATYPDATAAFAYTGTSFPVQSQSMNSPQGLAWDGTYFWVVGRNTDLVVKYNASGSYTGTSFSTASQATNPWDIVWDGTHLWVIDLGNNSVFKYNTSGVYQNVSFSVSAQETIPRG